MTAVPYYSSKISLLLVFAVAFSGNLFPTSIALIRSPRHIVIAADTKFSRTTPGGAQTEIIHYCKIQDIRGIFYGYAGLNTDSEGGYSLDKLAVNAIGSKRTLENVAAMLLTEVPGPLARALDRIKLRAPLYYKEHFAELRQVDVFLASVESGIPKVVVIGFQAENGTGRIVGRTAGCPGIACGTNGYVSTQIGTNKAAMNFIHTGDDAADARKMVEIEIAARPDIVGGPIDEVVLTPSGHQWTEPYGKCNHQ
jgi:hypothetical protein